ncbi:retrovirus-related Pol polyprotein from transposon 297 [Trichonephila clavipes]|nr:retrovirus-related Pol polyprotein from transposon 297 [Trichonephila clavipes]
MKPPRNSKEVSKFLGMSQWYAQFIKNYADLCEPLYKIKRKLKKFIWSIEAQKAFDAVKEAITKAPVLKFPDFKKPFELFTAASSIGVGAVLNQEQRPVVFASRTLSAAERNYTVTEREREGECLAVVWALNKFRTYLGCLPIKVIKDHAALTHLTNEISDGIRRNAEFAVGDIERLFEEARRNTKAKHEKWEKHYSGLRRDVQIKVNVWVSVATNPLSSATRKVVVKFKPKKCDETEIGTGSSDNGSLRDESSGFDRVQWRSNKSQDGKKKGSEVKRELEGKGLSFRNDQGEKHTNKTNKRGPLIRSIPSSWSEKGRMIKKRAKKERLGYKRSHESRSGGPERKVQKGSERRVNKRNLTSNDTNSVSPKNRKKSRREETVASTTSGYNLRPRNGKREESRPTIERKTQQG